MAFLRNYSWTRWGRYIVVGVFALALLVSLAVPQSRARANAILSVTPLTWNVIGLDSNNPSVGPNDFPIGVRVCNDATATTSADNVTALFNWVDPATGSTSTARIDPYNTNIWLRDGSLGYAANPFPGTSLAPGACTDFYFEVIVNRVAGAYSTADNPASRARYFITASGTAGGSPVSVDTVKPRELYVERLISQSRNAVTSVWLSSDMTNNADCSNDAYYSSIPAGGTMTLTKGSDYCIKVIGSTATNGYEQLESFITLPNRIFQILSVNTVYQTNNSLGHVSSPNPKLYADACVWDNDPNSPTYRSCLSTGKVGNAVTIVYKVHILNVGSSNPEPMSTLLYDFSGSSYHYNSDFSFSTRYVYILSPADMTISKQFVPATVLPGGTSTMIVTIANSAPSAVTGVVLTDGVNPLLPSGMTITGSQPGTPLIGCGSGTLSTTGSSFTFQNGTISANSSCIIKVNVTVPSGTTGSVPYTNTTGHLFYNTDTDTLKTATGTLTATAAPACTPGLLMARWAVPAGSSNAPDVASGTPNVGNAGTIGYNVATAQLSAAVPADTKMATSGQNDGTSWQTFGYKSDGQHIDFVLDTSHFSSISMSYWINNTSPNNFKGNLDITSSFGPGIASVGLPTASGFTHYTTDLAANTNPSGNTTISLKGTGANNDGQGVALLFDNIEFRGCGTPAPAPAISKAFSAPSVRVNGTSTLTFTLSNTAAGAVQQTGVTFTDTLPAGVQVAATPAASTTCGGTPTWGPPLGATTLTFGSPNGATIPAGGSCTVQVNVTPTTAGQFNNISGYVSSDQSGTTNSLAMATLSTILPPVISKSFGTSPILQNGTTSLTFTLTNPNQSGTLNGISFTDTFPAGSGLQVAATPAAGTTCTGSPTWAPAGGATALTFGSPTGTSLAAGASCSVSVNVTGTLATSITGLTNVSGNVTSTEAGNGNTASAALVVNAQTARLSVLKQIGTTATGPWGPVAAIMPPANVYYRFTLENDGDVPLTSASVVDTWLSTTKGASMTPCTGLTVPVGSASVDPFVSCVIGPVSIATSDPATYTNTANATASSSLGAVTSNDSSATYNAAALTLAKNVTETYFQAAGDALHYSYTVTNSGNASLLGPVTISDDKLIAEAVTVTCQDVSAVGDLDNYLDPGEQVTCPATGTAAYTVTSADVTAKVVTNTATASAGGITSNPATRTVPLIPDLTAAKTNDLPASPGNTMALGGSFNWTVQVSNASSAGPAIFTSGQKLLVDNLPAGPIYPASATVTESAGVTTGTGAITCSIAGNILTCTADGDTVTIPGGDWFKAQFSVTPAAAGSLVNPDTTGGGKCQADPDNLLVELDDANNACSNTVSVYAPPTLTKSFGATPINVGSGTTLTLTFSNPAGNPGALTGLQVDDTFPGSVSLANKVFAFTPLSCGTVTRTDDSDSQAGDGAVRFSVASLAAGASCEVQLNVISSGAGAVTNTTLAPTAAGPVALSGTAASAGITVSQVTPSIATQLKLVSDDSNLANSVAPGTTLYDTATLTGGYNPSGTVTYKIYSDNSCTTLVQDVTPAANTVAPGVVPASSTYTFNSVGSFWYQAVYSGDTNNNGVASVCSSEPVVVVSIDAKDDTGTTINGAVGGTPIANVLSDNGSGTDLLNGAAATTGSVTITTVGTWPTGISLNTTTGAVTVAAGTPAGTYTPQYQICDTATPTICDTATVTVKVVTIDAVNDTGADVGSATGGQSLANVMANDSLNGTTPVLLADVNLTQVSTTNAGVTLNVADGSVNVAAGTPVGSYTVTYQICDTLNPAVCDTATVTVKVVAIDAVNDTGATVNGALGGQSLANVLTNDSLNGSSPVALADVNLTQVSTTNAGVTLNTADGSINVAAGTPAGNYTVTYQICDQANPGVCDTADVTVPVATIDARNDAGTTINNALGGTSIVNVLADNGNGADLLDGAAATTSGVTITSVGTWPTGIALDTSTGAVDVAIGTTPGTYTPQYTICDQLNPTFCDTATVTVTVVSIAAKDDAGTTIDGTAGGTSIANVLANNGSGTDLLNGAAATTGNVTITAVGVWPTGISLNTTTGAVTVAAGTSPGTYTPQYQICDTANPSVCDTATVTVPVVTIEAKDDAGTAINTALGGTSIADVLADNGNGADLLNGVAAATGNVNITVVGSWPTGIALNTSTGAVTVAAGTAPGTYTPQYTICDKANPTICSTATVTVQVNEAPVPSADLSITKTDNSTTYTPGGSITYTITVTNNGTSDVTGATVADTIPANISGAAWTCAADPTASCTASGSGNINDSSVNLPSGTSVTYTVTGTVLSSATGTLSNTATVAAPAGTTDPDTNNNSALDEDSASASYDLSVTKTDGAALYTPGGSTTYTITVHNAGPSDATGVAFSDDIPSQVTGWTWSCVPDSGATCTLNGGATVTNYTDTIAVPSGKSVTYTVVAQIVASAAGDLSNTAEITAASDSTPGNNSATDTDTLSASADLSITKTDGSLTYTRGNSITYTIVISNAGPSDVTGATVTDTVPVDITGVTWTCVPAGTSSCTASGSGDINDTVNIPALSSVTYTLTGTVSASTSGDLTNTASVAAPRGLTDGNLNNNSASDTDTQVDIIDPAIAKGVDPAQAAIGDTVTFRILVTNNGSVAATNVVVTDPLPDNLDYVSAASSRTAPLPVVASGAVVLTPPRTVTVTLATVNPGDVFTIDIVTVVNGLGKPPVQNQASLTADPAGEGVLADPTANNSASAGLTVGAGGVAAARSHLWSKDLTVADIPITGFAPNVITALPPQPEASAYQDEASVRLEIPRLKLNLPIVGIPYANNTWDVTWLAKQAGWLQGTAFPSWPGNSVLTGHVYLSNGLPGPFIDVHTLQWGDQVIVHVGGQRYIYEVRSDQVLSPSDRSVLAHQTYPWLTLLTCKDYNAAADTYAHRVAVRAVLVKVEPDSSVRNDWR